ncbi:RnfH family protein [Collimonas sp. NPDC087041]|uniref:RnfH family protein n=1 Tax=Collimonas sp. NPDC087041 TaxID=3363960 RepID=UPI0037F51741
MTTTNHGSDVVGQPIRIQVCYATPELQVVRELEVPAGTLLHDGIKRSGLLQEMREIDLSCWRVGIYGKLKTLDTVLREHDRIEIYRPLIADPMESRRKRADKKAR